MLAKRCEVGVSCPHSDENCVAADTEGACHAASTGHSALGNHPSSCRAWSASAQKYIVSLHATSAVRGRQKAAVATALSLLHKLRIARFCGSNTEMSSSPHHFQLRIFLPPGHGCSIHLIGKCCLIVGDSVPRRQCSEAFRSTSTEYIKPLYICAICQNSCSTCQRQIADYHATSLWEVLLMALRGDCAGGEILFRHIS